jgi:hypothetical protein
MKANFSLCTWQSRMWGWITPRLLNPWELFLVNQWKGRWRARHPVWTFWRNRFLKRTWAHVYKGKLRTSEGFYSINITAVWVVTSWSVVEATDISQVLRSSTIRLISLMIMEPVSTSEMSLNPNQAIRRHIQKTEVYVFTVSCTLWKKSLSWHWN